MYFNFVVIYLQTPGKVVFGKIDSDKESKNDMTA